MSQSVSNPQPFLTGIIGHGVDMVSIARIRALVAQHPTRARARIFTEAEWAYAQQQQDPTPALAKRWAAKEACAKALGCGIRGAVTLRSIEVVNAAAGVRQGQPTLQLHAGAADFLHSCLPTGSMPSLHLSLSDEGDLAMASVIISALPLPTGLIKP